MKGKKVAVIGAGNMGGALVSGMVASGLLPPEQIVAVDVVEGPLERLRTEVGVGIHRDARAVAGEQDVIVLAVKPQIWRAVVEAFSDKVTPEHLVLSVMGGVRTSAIEECLKARVPVVRAMPNILAQVRASVSAVCPGRYADEVHVATACDILCAVGQAVQVREDQMDAVTGLSGSGPAYVFTAIDALADGGVKVGLPRDVALMLAAQTVFGAAKMVLESGEHPAALKDRVTSPGGTTIAGLCAMEQGGFRAALIAGVEAAARRSEELGK